MTTELKEMLDDIDSQVNKCYDYARKRFDDPFGEWEEMWDMIIDLRGMVDKLKRICHG